MEIEIPIGETLRQVGTGDWSAIPCIKQEENGLHRNPDQIAFVSHNLEPLI